MPGDRIQRDVRRSARRQLLWDYQRGRTTTMLVSDLLLKLQPMSPNAKVVVRFAGDEHNSEHDTPMDLSVTAGSDGDLCVIEVDEGKRAEGRRATEREQRSPNDLRLPPEHAPSDGRDPVRDPRNTDHD